MRFDLIVVWFHLKLCMKKDGDLALANNWPMIERKKNLISMHWVAFFNIFYVMVHAYKFHGDLKTAW